MFEETTISFIGSGRMAEAMIARLLKKKLVSSDCIIASGPRQARGEELNAKYAVKTTTDNVYAIKNSDICVLSVKPQMFQIVLEELKGHSDSTLIISIAAGISIASMQSVLDEKVPIVRTMPNTPGRVNQGITVWTTSPSVDEEHKEWTRTILSSFGEEIWTDREQYLDMATALSGTGPSYTFLFMEALVDAGVHLGFPRDFAERLVLQTVRGSAEYAQKTNLHLAAMRNEVTSPAGTSASALYELEKAGFRAILSRAVLAAYERSCELGGNK